MLLCSSFQSNIPVSPLGWSSLAGTGQAEGLEYRRDRTGCGEGVGGQQEWGLGTAEMGIKGQQEQGLEDSGNRG